MRQKTSAWDLAVFIALVFCLLLLSSQLVMTVQWRIKRGSRDTDDEQIICQPCSELKINGHSLPSECTANETDKCCCPVRVVVDAIIGKSTTSLFQRYKLRGTASIIHTNCQRKQTTLAKVAGIDYDSLKKDTRESDLVYWGKSDLTILQSIRYTNARLIISQPGFYYVFSQIKYEHDPEAAKNSVSRQSHSLHRYSLRTREQKLLENTRTYAELHLPVNNSTSNIGAVFRLEKNDEIMIKSSHTHRLSGNDRENFFGLYIL